MKKLTAEQILEAKFRFQSCMPIQEGMQKRLILEAIHEFAEQDKWIDVNDKEKPTVSKTVILTDGIIQYMGFYSYNHKWMLLGQAVRTESKTKITHWKYQDNLPKPPTK